MTTRSNVRPGIGWYVSPKLLRELSGRRVAQDGVRGDHDGGVTDTQALACEKLADVVRFVEVDPAVGQAVSGGEGTQSQGLA